MVQRILFLCAVLLLSPLLAEAQLNATRSNVARRPSDQVGVTGGRTTRDTGVSRPRRGGGSAGNAVRLPSQEELRRGSPLPPSLLPAAFQLGRPGFNFNYGHASRVFRYQDPVELGRLERISGLSKSLRRGKPLIELPAVTPRMPRTPYYAPARPQSAFHDFFDLQPSPPEEVVNLEKDPPSLNYADLLQRENEEFTRRKRERAMIAFKKGTTPKQENRYGYMTEALDLFHSLRKPSADDEVPFDEAVTLLAMIGHLEKGQYASSGRAMMELIRNRPDFFNSRPELEEYFGDPQVLRDILRKNRQVGDRNPAETIAYGLQAFCQWMLEDETRTREALATMLERNQQLANDPRINQIGVALQVALK